MDIGAMALLALCKEQNVAQFHSAKLTEEHFLGDEKPLWTFVVNHVHSYNALPKITTLNSAFSLTSVAKAVNEPAEFYVDKLDERHVHRTLVQTMQAVQDHLINHQYGDAINFIESSLAAIQTHSARHQIVDFAQDAFKMVMDDYHKKQHPGGEGIYFGWPTLDGMVAGLGPGDVVSFVGRPAMGKTWQLLYSALYSWRKQTKNIMFVSMEMNPLTIVKRLTSLYAKMPISQLKAGDITTKGKEKMQNAFELAQAHGSKFWVIDGNLSATVPEVFSMASQLKPNAIFIDGAYMLQHSNRRLDRFQRAAENIEEIKRLGSKQAIPAALSYQFSRELTKKKKGKAGLEHIGYTDAVGQISSIVLGLFEEENIETMHKRKIQILKDREGATGEFTINWDFKKMDFTETQGTLDDESDLICV